jgi:hypothetical protein
MQRKSIRVLLTVMAVFAMTAVAASAAFAAEPEFKPGTKQAFTGTTGPLVIASAALSETCSKGSSAGEITSASTASAVLTFTGCEVKAATSSCSLTSVGAINKGEIVTKALNGELGTTTEATSGVGLLLEPASGEELTKIEAPCMSPAKWTIEGSVAAEVTPLKTSAKTLKLVFAPAKTGGASKIREITVKGKKEKPELDGFDGATISWATTESLEFKSNALEVT